MLQDIAYGYVIAQVGAAACDVRSGSSVDLLANAQSMKLAITGPISYMVSGWIGAKLLEPRFVMPMSAVCAFAAGYMNQCQGGGMMYAN
jgi:hypothetical protein